MLINKLNDILNTTKQDDIYHIICSFVKDHMEQMPDLSIDETAQGCYVSKSMITKFIHRLGYDSYKEFKYDCALMNQALTNAIPFDTYEQEGIKEHARLRMHMLTDAWKEVFEHIDFNQLERLVEDILAYRTIVLFGHGTSKLSCELLQNDLAYAKIPTQIADIDFENVSLTRDTLILMISAGGHLFEYRQRLVQKLMQLPQKKWLITCEETVSWQPQDTLYIPSLDQAFNDELVQWVMKLITNECYHRCKVHNS